MDFLAVSMTALKKKTCLHLSAFIPYCTNHFYHTPKRGGLAARVYLTTAALLVPSGARCGCVEGSGDSSQNLMLVTDWIGLVLNCISSRSQELAAENPTVVLNLALEIPCIDPGQPGGN